MKKPNILFIMTDQHRFDCLGCMGHSELHTPNLDRLAQKSTVFDQAYTPSPVCGPARASIFSGRFAPASGAIHNWIPFDNTAILLPEHLKNSGYFTGSVGKLHFVPHEKSWGFDSKKLHDAPHTIYANDAHFSDYVRWLREKAPEQAGEWIETYDDDERQYPEQKDIKRFILGSNHVPEELHMTTWTVDESLAFLKEAEGREEPFFLFTSFFGPHQPYGVPGNWSDRYPPEKVNLPSHFDEKMDDCPIFAQRKAAHVVRNRALFSEDEYREMIAAYYANISMLDSGIGKILDAVEASGQWDNTLIVFSSDHGDYCGQYGLFFKGDMYEASVKVPLMIKPPGPPREGRHTAKPVSTLGLYGTLLDAAGSTAWKKPDIESESLWPELESPDGIQARADDRVFAIIGKDPDLNHCMLRKGTWKLIRQARGEDEPLYELFNVADSPFDKVNRANDPGAAGILSGLRAELDAWWLEQKNKYPGRVVEFSAIE